MKSKSTPIELEGIERSREVNRQLKKKKGPYYEKWKKNILKAVNKHGSKHRK